jgi:hypothetical protein
MLSKVSSNSHTHEVWLAKQCTFAACCGDQQLHFLPATAGYVADLCTSGCRSLMMKTLTVSSSRQAVQVPVLQQQRRQTWCGGQRPPAAALCVWMLSQAARAAKLQAKRSRLQLLGPRVLVASGRQRRLLVVLQFEAKPGVVAAAGRVNGGLRTVVVSRKMMTMMTVMVEVFLWYLIACSRCQQL